MKILYISDSYSLKGNSASVRNNSLVKGLISLGHSVDVWAVRYDEIYMSENLKIGNVRYFDLFNLKLREYINTKEKANPFINSLRNIYVKLRKYIQFPDSCYQWPSKIEVKGLSDYNIMVSSSDGKISHFVGEKIQKANKRIKWIQIWGDPWYDDLNSSIFDKIRITYYEKKLLKDADKVIYVSKPTANLIKTKYYEFKDKILFIPRSYYEAYNYQVTSEENLHIVYTGLLNANYGRNITELVEVVETYNNTNSQKIFIDVYGNIDQDLKSSIHQKCIHFYPSVDIVELGNVYKSSNALLYISNKSGTTQIPGKLYDYLGTSSLILCLVNDKNDEISCFLKSIGERCLLVENKKEEIVDALPTIISKMKKSYEVDKKYSPQNIAKQVILSMIPNAKH